MENTGRFKKLSCKLKNYFLQTGKSLQSIYLQAFYHSLQYPAALKYLIISEFRIFLYFFLPALLFSCQIQRKEEPKQVRIIFDTDFGPDYDDVGALTMLHAFADSGKAVILAAVASNQNELVVPSIDVVNTYFGRPDIPIGTPSGKGVNVSCWQKWTDSITSVYPHKLKKTGDAADATLLYRKILSREADKSITIVTTGFLTNMKNLLESAPDSISPLKGIDLVERKVLRLVSMAGEFPKGKEWNMLMDSTASKETFDLWPIPVILTGGELGSKIFTGLRLIQMPAERLIRFKSVRWHVKIEGRCKRTYELG